MISLLYFLIFAEMALIVLMSFKTPLRKLLIMGLDRVKRGHGPVVMKTFGGTVFVMLISSLYSMKKILSRGIEDGIANPTDQVLMAGHLLEASLMGFLLFLGLMIDRLHHYMRELRLRRKSMEDVKKQSRVIEDVKANGLKEMKALEGETTTLRAKLEQLEFELAKKTKEGNAAEANVMALRKQSEGFLLEYDRLLEENQSLRKALQSLDRSLSHSGSKKNT